MRLKLLLKIISALLLIALPFTFVPLFAVFSAPEFDESFVGALSKKVERLSTLGKNKIVIVGGSSATFGYDSALIEKYTGMPVVNLGLYAALGTKLMLDISREHIEKGDIVILAPELDGQTLSLYFSASTALFAFDGSPHLYRYVKGEHIPSLLGASWDFAAQKLDSKINGKTTYSGVYSASSFNEYGDICYPRAENTIPMYYDENTIIDLSPDIVDGDFLLYLNEYIADCKAAGASVYFEFCPMNRLALSEGSTEKSRAEFSDYICASVDAAVIASDIENYIYDEGYFYDTNFHLNDAGVIKHTVNVVKDILLELGIPKAVKEEIPEPPLLPQIDVRFFGEDENAKMFEYTRLADGSYMISGVKTEYLDREALTVPLGYDTYKVTAIGEGAFEGSEVRKLIITENTNISALKNGCFEGAVTLSELWIYYPYEEKIMPPVSFHGTAQNFRVFVPEGSAYKQGYYWGERGLVFEFIK